jgi:hypothetical protein
LARKAKSIEQRTLFLSTSKIDALERFEGGKFREATQEECVSALRSIPLAEITSSPMGYQALAVAIARHDAFVGKLTQ